MSRGRKSRGHFCWCCGRTRSNESFSGRGHARHICKDCAKLGKDELAYRQEVRNVDRLLDWDGVIRRKQRKAFERYLAHADERVRRYAQEVAAADARAREAHRQERLAWEREEAAVEGAIEGAHLPPEVELIGAEDELLDFPDPEWNR